MSVKDTEVNVTLNGWKAWLLVLAIFASGVAVGTVL